jgi:hypothetical protein
MTTIDYHYPAFEEDATSIHQERHTELFKQNKGESINEFWTRINNRSNKVKDNLVAKGAVLDSVKIETISGRRYKRRMAKMLAKQARRQ